MDQKRAKRDSKDYAEMEAILKANSTKPQDVSEVESNEIMDRYEKESSKRYSVITPLVWNLSLKTYYDVDKLDAVLNAML